MVLQPGLSVAMLDCLRGVHGSNADGVFKAVSVTKYHIIWEQPRYDRYFTAIIDKGMNRPIEIKSIVSKARSVDIVSADDLGSPCIRLV